MLCPVCGAEVGDALKLCPPCDERKQALLRAEEEQNGPTQRKRPEVGDSGPGASAKDADSPQDEFSEDPLQARQSVKGPILFLLGVILAGGGFLIFFFFGGPTSVELDRARSALVGLVCQTNTVEQVKSLQGQLLFESGKSVLSANIMSKWKIVDATVMSILKQSGLNERQFSKLRRMSDEKRLKFVSGILDQAQLTCMYNPDERSGAMKALEWITTEELGRFRS